MNRSDNLQPHSYSDKLRIEIIRAIEKNSSFDDTNIIAKLEELRLLSIESNLKQDLTNAKIDELKIINTLISSFVDDLESGQIVSQNKLDEIISLISSTSVDEVTELIEIKNFLDSLVVGQIVTNTELLNIKGFVDNLETLTQTLIDEVDEVEEILTVIKDLLTGQERNIDTIEVISTGNQTTISGVQSVALWFRGNGGTLNGVNMPNNAAPSFEPNKGADTLSSINFTVPTTGQQRVILFYVYN